MNAHVKACLALVALLSAVPACKQERSSGTGESSGAAAALPKEFPAALAIYPGARIVSSALDAGVNRKPERTVEIASKDDVEKVRAFYAPANLKGLKYNSGDGSPGHPAWFTDPQRFIDVRITIWKEGAEAHATLVANLM